MARAGLDRRAVVTAALELLDESGALPLTMAAVAARLGVRTPSLYKHVRDLGDLRNSVGVAAKQELALVLQEAVAGRSGGTAVRALAASYRDWASAHPGPYPLTVAAPEPSNADDVASSRQLVKVLESALRAYTLTDAEQIHAIRFFRATIHGFVTLEALGGFALPTDLNESFEYAIDTFIRSLAAQ